MSKLDLITTITGCATGIFFGLAADNVMYGLIASTVASITVYGFGSWWNSRRLAAEVTSDPRDADKRSFESGVLPCCGSTEFLEGPSGGLSVNIICAKCKTRWNVAFVNGVCLMADRL